MPSSSSRQMVKSLAVEAIRRKFYCSLQTTSSTPPPWILLWSPSLSFFCGGGVNLLFSPRFIPSGGLESKVLRLLIGFSLTWAVWLMSLRVFDPSLFIGVYIQVQAHAIVNWVKYLGQRIWHHPSLSVPHNHDFLPCGSFNWVLNLD